MKVLRFLFAGGTGFVVNIAVLYLLTDVIGWWYLLSATFAFLISFAVSFILHKFWTFADHTTDRIPHQAAIYLGLALFNLLLNNSVLYFLVEFAGFHYISGQVGASLVVATWSFFVYRWLFRARVLPEQNEDKLGHP